MEEKKSVGPVVVIEVRDTGKGISKSELEKIFDPFFTTKEGGTGLGLSISYQIVNEHGGLLEVKSNPQEGTSFFLYLPVGDSKRQKEVLLEVQKRDIRRTGP